MKRYTVTLTGNNKLVIDEQQKKKIDYAKESGENYFITVGDSSFETGSVRLITPLIEEKVGQFDEKMKQDSINFFNDLKERQKMNAMEKAKWEWQRRIAPGLLLGNISLDKRYEQIIKHFIVDFFQDHPSWPYCDIRAWWVWISYFIKERRPFMSKWFEYVIRHDGQVKNFMNYQSK